MRARVCASMCVCVCVSTCVCVCVCVCACVCTNLCLFSQFVFHQYDTGLYQVFDDTVYVPAMIPHLCELGGLDLDTHTHTHTHTQALLVSCKGVAEETHAHIEAYRRKAAWLFEEFVCVCQRVAALTLTKGASASLARRRAISVLPHPVGPVHTTHAHTHTHTHMTLTCEHPAPARLLSRCRSAAVDVALQPS